MMVVIAMAIFTLVNIILTHQLISVGTKSFCLDDGGDCHGGFYPCPHLITFNIFQWAQSPFVSMMVVIAMVVPVPISFYLINLFQWAPSPFVPMMAVIAMAVFNS